MCTQLWGTLPYSYRFRVEVTYELGTGVDRVTWIVGVVVKWLDPTLNDASPVVVRG